MTFKAKIISAEGIGFDDLGTRLQVLVVNAANEVGLGEVQLVVATVDEHTLGVQQRAHGAVAEYGRCCQSLSKITGHIVEDTAGKLAAHSQTGGPAAKMFADSALI